MRVTENLALILGLQGKYDEMAAVSGSHVPENIVEQNTKLLQEMIQPVRSWEALAGDAAPTVPDDSTQEAASGLRLRRTPG